MRDEVPAALPLIAFAAALALQPSLVNPLLAVTGCIAVACLGRRPVAVVCFFLALGTAVGLHDEAVRRRELQTFTSFGSERFVAIETPLQRDWTERPHVFVLRSTEFRANGHHFEAPISIYARFPPRRIEMESHARLEGTLRRDERGRYSVAVKSARLMSYQGRLPWWSPPSWNRAIANRLRNHADQRPAEIAMTEALLLGRGERLDDATREGFKRGGTYHLLVFSGLQISLAAAAIALLLRWIGAPRASDWSLLAFAIVAPAFIGPGASVARASVGIALYAISRIVKRPTTFENLWCVAALIRLIAVPGDLSDPAFHLTYAGAGALLFIGKPLARSSLRRIAYVVAAEIAIAPLTLFHFHQYALGGSLLTIVMTPVVLVMLLFGAAFAATEVTIILDAIALLHSLCVKLNALAAPASGFFTAPPVAAMTFGFGSAIAAIALLRGRARTTAVVVALLLPLAAATTAYYARRTAGERITVLDVGQGDAIAIRSGRRTILVDGGGRYDDLRFGEGVLLPLLLDRGIRNIDKVILTHAHPDHCIGLVAAVRHLRVGEIVVPPRHFRGDCAALLADSAITTSTPMSVARDGEAIDLDRIRATVFVSTRHYKKSPQNNASVVLRVVAASRSTLLTGDIERPAELDLAERFGHADILKIPHHGSRSSTSTTLLGAVTPRWTVISCGLDNFFGHPHPDVLRALGERGIRLRRTDHHGTVDIDFADGHIAVRTQIDTLP